MSAAQFRFPSCRQVSNAGKYWGLSDKLNKLRASPILSFEGAITNARSLIESICKYILDDSGVEYDAKADLPSLYKDAANLLNMHPSQHVAAAFKQILSGCFSIVQGFARVRNKLSDAHGKSSKKHYKPDERHAMFVVGAAKTLADFMYASFTERKKPTK